MSDLSIRAQARSRFHPSVLAALDKNPAFLTDPALDIHAVISHRRKGYMEDVNKQRAFLKIMRPEQGLAQSVLDETPPLPIPDDLDLRPLDRARIWHSLVEGSENHVIAMVAAFKPATMRGKNCPNYQADKKYRLFLPHQPVVVEAAPFGFSENKELVATQRWLETHENFQGFSDMFAAMARAQGTVMDNEQAEAAFKQGTAALAWISYQAHCLGVKQSYIGYLLFFRMLHLLQSDFPGEIWHSVRFDFNRLWAWLHTIEKLFADRQKKRQSQSKEMDKQAVLIAARSKQAGRGALAKDADEDDWALPIRSLFDNGVENFMASVGKMNQTELLAVSAKFPRTPMLHHLLEKVKVLEKMPSKMTSTSAVSVDDKGNIEFHTQAVVIDEEGNATVKQEESVPHTPISFDSGASAAEDAKEEEAEKPDV